MHDGQKRKLTALPYILHPMEAAIIVSTMTNDEDVIVSALLHDVIEDTEATEQEVKELFGDRVLSLVKSETENKRKDLPPDATWRIRKEESIEELRCSTKESKMLWLADKLSNMRSIALEYINFGDELFNAFHEKRKSEHAWYYGSILEILREDLGSTFAFIEYEKLINFVFKGEK